MHLVRATQEQLTTLMTWFDDKAACRIWGGPYFRYPYNLKSFEEDMAWGVYDSFSLLGGSDVLLGFGQLFIKERRIHLARVAVSPEHRGCGYGTELVKALMEEGRVLFELSEFSLYVYKHNKAAIQCYQGIGFERYAYPLAAPFEQECYFMVKKD